MTNKVDVLIEELFEIDVIEGKLGVSVLAVLHDELSEAHTVEAPLDNAVDVSVIVAGVSTTGQI